MAGRKFEGVTTADEVSSLRMREDLRSLPQKLRDFWLEPFGQQTTYFIFLFSALLFFWVPLGGEIVLLLMYSFYLVKLRYKKMKWDFPFRVPINAALIDGSTNGQGKGLMYLGSESTGKMPAYISDNDCRTHALIFGTTGSGKAQPLDAKVHTPLGWRLMGSLKVGDYVTAHDNSAVKVLGVYPQGIREMYKVTFEDGRSTEACGEHLWEVHHKHWNGKYKPGVSRAGCAQPRVMSTLALADQLSRSQGKFSVPLPAPIEKPHVNLPLHPYLLGILIGDGHLNKYLRVSSADQEILEAVSATLPETMELRQYESDGKYDYWICSKREFSARGRTKDGGYVRNPVKVILGELGLAGCTSPTKFVPALYKEASLAQRRMLLQGLMDADGYPGSTCTSVSFSSVSKQLALDVQEIVRSLGGIAKITTKTPTYTYQGETREGQMAYTVNIRHPDPQSLFSLERKRTKLGEYQYASSLKLGVKSIEKIGSKSAQCILIDHPRHLYVTDDYVVTHNTEFLLGFVTNALFYGGGSSYTDGKGDVKLLAKYMDLCRLVGREHDLLLISFITSGKEFYDRQETLASNTLNPYSNGSSGMCTEASIALMDSGGGDDMWKGRAIAFLGGLIKPLVFLRDRGEILLSGDLIRTYFDLPMLERFVYDEEDTWKGGIKRPKGYFSKTYGKLWDVVIRPLKAFMGTIPGYDVSKLGKQEQKTLEQHGYITMQLARLFGDLADNYGHIMDTPLGHVDMYDVVINNRILLTLLPALERSPESLGMLGKIIVGGIKQMAAGCLGNRTEGLRREIVDARPTNAPVPFPCIFDEYGYYAVLGFSSMPAQARSLGFMVVFAAQDFASLKKSSPEEADQTWENTNLRGIGRITSGANAETYKRMEELGGTALVAEADGYERIPTMWGFRLRRGEGVKLQPRSRVQSDDLHSQADGEFHLFLGKKENEASQGRVRIARVNGFYTDLKPPPRMKKVKGKDVPVFDKRMQPGVRHLALNHFARVSAPAVLQNEDEDSGLIGPRGLLAQMRERDFKKLVQARELPLPRYSELIQIDALDRSWGSKAYGVLDAGVIGIVMTTKGNGYRLGIQAAIMALSADIKRAAEGGAGASGSGDGTESGSASGGGAAPARVMKPRKPAERISLHEQLTKDEKQVISVPVTPNSPEEIRELVEDARGVGFKVKHQDSVDVVRESIQTGVLEMEIDSLKGKKGVEAAMVDASAGIVGGQEGQEIAKQADKLKVYLDQATSYIDEPTPDLNNIRVSDSDAVANQLFMALSRPDAPWSSVVGR